MFFDLLEASRAYSRSRLRLFSLRHYYESRTYVGDKNLFENAEAVRLRDCQRCPFVDEFEMGRTSKGLK